MRFKRKKPVAISAREANLKRRLRRHLSLVGFKKGPDGNLVASGSGKEVIRSLHHEQRNEPLRQNRKHHVEDKPEIYGHCQIEGDAEAKGTRPR